MADKDKITLWAEAKRLLTAGHEEFQDYRKIEPTELASMIAKAKRGTSAPAKGKPAATNGTKGKAAATAAVKGKPAAPAKGKAAASPAKGKTSASPAKGKATSTAKRAPAAQSTARKTAPAKGKAAQGKATRPATGGKGKAAAATRGKPNTTASRTTAAKRTSTPRTRGKQAESYVVKIDNRSVNWKAPWGGGQTGKRKVVLDSLRQHKGDKAKVFAEVKRYATKWYPDKDKYAADRMVVWLIGRVALDFAKGTNQHESGQRAAYGTSEKPNDVRRREARASARPAPRKRAAGKPAAAKAAPAKGKAAPARGKPAAARTAAPKGKPATTRGKATTTTRRAPAKGKPATAAKGKGRR